MTITGVSLRLPIISTMKSLFLLNSSSLILADPSNKKTTSTDLFVRSGGKILNNFKENVTRNI